MATPIKARRRSLSWDMKIRMAPTPELRGLYQERVKLLALIKKRESQFDREPSEVNAILLAALREQCSQVELRIASRAADMVESS